MQDVEHARAHAPARRLVRYGATGLAVGGFIGYVGALVRPRRFPATSWTYEAPVPARLPQQRTGLDAHQPSSVSTAAAATSDAPVGPVVPGSSRAGR